MLQRAKLLHQDWKNEKSCLRSNKTKWTFSYLYAHRTQIPHAVPSTPSWKCLCLFPLIWVSENNHVLRWERLHNYSAVSVRWPLPYCGKLFHPQQTTTDFVQQSFASAWLLWCFRKPEKSLYTHPAYDASLLLRSMQEAAQQERFAPLNLQFAVGLGPRYSFVWKLRWERQD